ncbi:MAG: DUF167 family protein [Pseudomonadota bacterium]
MTGGDEPPWRIAGGRLVVRVRLTPKSSRDAVEGLEATAEGPALKARVRAVPEDGAANAALERLVADWLGVARRDVQLEKGAKSRVKSLVVAGEPGMLMERLQRRLAEQG